MYLCSNAGIWMRRWVYGFSFWLRKWSLRENWGAGRFHLSSLRWILAPYAGITGRRKAPQGQMAWLRKDLGGGPALAPWGWWWNLLSSFQSISMDSHKLGWEPLLRAPFASPWFSPLAQRLSQNWKRSRGASQGATGTAGHRKN